MTLRIGIAQIAPVFLDRAGTIEKILSRLEEAAQESCQLVTFGETLASGYPAWLSLTHGARFDDPVQKDIHAHYLDQAVCLERGDLESLCKAARSHRLGIVLGITERPEDRGGHTIYCSRVYIDSNGNIGSVHRKLMPTYEERLAWGIGDGAGLVTHRVGEFTLGALNCWENWLPLARAALYAQGEDLHVMLWPGSLDNTKDLTRFVARESRSYVVSACGLLRDTDVPMDFPHRDLFIPEPGVTFLNGGSSLAGPDGEWIVEPVVDEETLLVADLDPAFVLRERQNFDVAGHYARPDVLRLVVDRRRQSLAEFLDDEDESKT
ncbi:MAG: carbon-nitrogen hydrolase family protein [Planctomycetota bacterium]|nr:carbon-nitrogen hydrolase family protein [Planctomycetota bacterium]